MFLLTHKKSLFKLHGHEEGYEENIAFLHELDQFIEKEVAPHAYQNDGRRNFPHRNIS